jgi:hypothetical protein
MSEPFFLISYDDYDHALLHIQMSSATEMSFDIQIKGLDFDDVFKEICFVVPAIMRQDAVLMELMDGAEDKTNAMDILKINRFARKYREHFKNVDVYVTDQFGGDVP